MKDLKTFEEFLEYGKVVKKGSDECWEWGRGKMGTGYGCFGIEHPDNKHRLVKKSKTVTAHKFAFELFYNCRLASNLQVRHICDNRLCVNPKHLLCGRNKANVDDKVSRNRQNCKITRSQRQEVIDLYKTGKYTHKELGRKFGVHKSLISLIVSQKDNYAITN